MEDTKVDDAPLQPFNTCGSCWWNIDEDGKDGKSFCTSLDILQEKFECLSLDYQLEDRLRVVSVGRISTVEARTNTHGRAVYHCPHFKLPPSLADVSPGSEPTKHEEKGTLGSLMFTLGLGVVVVAGVWQLVVVLWRMVNG